MNNSEYVSIDVHPNKGREIKYNSAEDVLTAILLAVKIQADKLNADYLAVLADFVHTLSLPEIKEQSLQIIKDNNDDTLF